MITAFEAKVLVETESLSHNEWLEYRKKGIGGSDIAAICGLSKWRRPIHVYLEKIGEAPQEEMSEAAEWGILHGTTAIFQTIIMFSCNGISL